MQGGVTGECLNTTLAGSWEEWSRSEVQTTVVNRYKYAEWKYQLFSSSVGEGSSGVAYVQSLHC